MNTNNYYKFFIFDEHDIDSYYLKRRAYFADNLKQD